MRDRLFQKTLVIRLLPVAAVLAVVGQLAITIPNAAAQAPAAPAAAPAAAGTPALPPDSFTANAMLREGGAAFDKGDYKTTIEKMGPYCAYQEKLTILDNYDNVLFCLGYAHFAEKQFGKSVEYIQKYIAKYPTGQWINDAGMTLAKAHFFAKEYDKSIAQFTKLRNIPSLREEVMPMLAEVYLKHDQGGEAMKVFEEYLAAGYNNTDRINAALQLAGMYLATGKTDKGIEVLEKVKASPSSADYVIILNSKALETANSLLQDNPMSALRAFQAVRWKNEVVKLQSSRLEVLNAKVDEWKRLRQTTTGAAASRFEDLASRGKERHDQLKQMIEDISKEENYDATLVYSIARCFSSLKRHWEAELAFRTVVTKFPKFGNAGDAMLGQILSLVSLKRNEDALKVCWEFLDKYKDHRDAATVSEMIVGMSIEAKDMEGAKKAVTQILKVNANPPNKSKLLLLSSIVDFENYEFAKGREVLQQIKAEFPNDDQMEEIEYRHALSYFFTNEQQPTLEHLGKFLEKYPNSPLIPDARYRLNLMQYGIENSKKNKPENKKDKDYKTNFGVVIDDVKRTIERFPAAINLGELYALIGDCYNEMSWPEAQSLGLEQAQNNPTFLGANAYRDAVLKSGRDNVEVREYALDQANKKLSAEGRFDELQKLYRDLMDKYPSHADRLTWLGEETKAISRQGNSVEERLKKKAEVKQVLTKEIMLNINKPNKEGVERLLEQLASACVPKAKRVAPSADGTPAPAPADPYEEGSAELEALLQGKLNTTGKARLTYAKYLLMGAVPGKVDPTNPRKRLDRTADRDKMLEALATDFRAEDFSSSLLAVLGDFLLTKGMDEKAVTFFNRLIQFFPKSDYLDFAYVGLGDIARKEKNFPEAKEKYKHAVEKLPGIKYPNALLGLSYCLIEEKNYTDPTKHLEEIVGVKEWKGPLHAEALYLLGESSRLAGNYPAAVNFFGRIFLSLAKYEDWAIKGYLGAEESHRSLGEIKQSVNALQEAKEYLVKRKLESSPLMDAVKARANDRGVILK